MRSHADDTGLAIALLTSIITADTDNAVIRGLVRDAMRSAVEVIGVATSLARIASDCITALAEVERVDRLELLQRYAAPATERAFQLDDEFGRPLPGSTYLDTMTPPSADFLADELGEAVDRLNQIVADYSERDEVPDEERRRLFWLMQWTRDAMDTFDGVTPPDL